MIHSYDVTQVPKFSSSLCPKLSRSVLALTMAQVAGMAVRDAAPLSVLECKAGLLQRSTKVQEDTGRNHHSCSKFPKSGTLAACYLQLPDLQLYSTLFIASRVPLPGDTIGICCLPLFNAFARAQNRAPPQLPWRHDTNPSFAMPGTSLGGVIDEMPPWTRHVYTVLGVCVAVDAPIPIAEEKEQRKGLLWVYQYTQSLNGFFPFDLKVHSGTHDLQAKRHDDYAQRVFAARLEKKHWQDGRGATTGFTATIPHIHTPQGDHRCTYTGALLPVRTTAWISLAGLLGNVEGRARL
ncbi:hypothetical protein CPB85DRAFT_1463880 [Mucidula mucida]|nr:hypothetical protein CPB85DRAFT_1463880 [Mucidula mucida]